MSEGKTEMTADTTDLALKPFVVIGDWGGLDAAGQKILVDSLERASKKALQSVLAEASLKNESPGPGLIARAVKRLDDEMAAEVAAGPLHDLLITTQQTSQAEVAMMLVDRDTVIPADAQLGTLSSFQSGSM